MTNRTKSTRRRLLGAVGATVTIALTGCLHGSDADDQPSNGNDTEPVDDDTDDTDDGTEPDDDTELTTEAAEETVSNLLNALSIADVAGYNALLHTSGNVEPEDEDEVFLNPSLEVDAIDVIELEGDTAVVDVELYYELGEVAELTRWEVELRGDGDEWRVWDITTGIGVDDPAQSPEVVVAEFLDALDRGELDEALDFLHEDSDQAGYFEENIDTFEQADVIVDSDVVLERQPGWASIGAEIRDGEDSTPEQWRFTLVVDDRVWKVLEVHF